MGCVVLKSIRFLAVFVCLAALAVILGGYAVFSDTTIHCGFSEDMKEWLADQYSLCIPDSAQFLEGYYEPEIARDRFVYITFTVPKADVSVLTQGIDPSFWHESGGSTCRGHNALLTIDFDDSDVLAQCQFKGRHPKKTIAY